MDIFSADRHSLSRSSRVHQRILISSASPRHPLARLPVFVLLPPFGSASSCNAAGGINATSLALSFSVSPIAGWLDEEERRRQLLRILSPGSREESPKPRGSRAEGICGVHRETFRISCGLSEYSNRRSRLVYLLVQAPSTRLITPVDQTFYRSIMETAP